MRLDKIRLAALEAVLRLYADPDRLAVRLPALRLLTRPRDEIRALAERLLPSVARALDGAASVAPVETRSQIGSGALPVSLLPSAGLALAPVRAAAHGGGAVEALARRLRDLPIPVIGRIEAAGSSSICAVSKTRPALSISSASSAVSRQKFAERGDGLGVAAFVKFGRMQEGGRCATVWQVSIM